MSADNYQHIDDFLKDPTFVNWVEQTDRRDIIKWERWLEEHPEHREMAEQARMILKGIEFKPQFISSEKVDIQWNKFNQARLQQNKEKQQQRRLKVRRIWWSAAASVAVLLVALFAYNIYWHQETVFQTAYGERMELELPDGTEISLNSNSTLKYVRNNPRKVWLEGEAYFTVKKKPEKGDRFFVITKDLEVEVLGTVFNVNSREEQTQVVLEEGKVKLDLKEKGTLVMKPGDLVAYSSAKKEVAKKEEVKPELHTSWKDGVLQFDNTPLPEALKILEDTYGVEVIFQDTSNTERILNGGVPNDNLEVFIRTLKTIYGLDIVHVNDQLIIR